MRTADRVAATTPVGHHDTFVSPLISENGCQQITALTCHLAVDLIIRAHDCPGLRLLDGNLKVLQIYFTGSTLADNSVVAQSGGLLVVESKVLDGGADSLALYAVDIGGCYVAC